jgi:hypothetical protein
MVNARQWQSLNPLHQFKKLPTDVVRTLDKKNLTFDRLYDLDAHQLGEMIRLPKMGKPLYKFIRQVFTVILLPNLICKIFKDPKAGHDNVNPANYPVNITRGTYRHPRL